MISTRERVPGMQTTKEVTPQRLTKQMNLFRDFLIATWPHLDKAMEEHDWEDDLDLSDDWIQMNWKMFVERELLGIHAQLSPLSIWIDEKYFENKKKHYTVVTEMTSEVLDASTHKPLPVNIPLRLIGFYAPIKYTSFGLYPPFNIALLYHDETKKLYYLYNENFEFYLLEWDAYISNLGSKDN